MASKKRILVMFGTRPEAIKMAPVHAALRQRSDVFETLCCVTAQHRHLLDQVLETFAILPDRDLDLMREEQELAGLTAHVLAAVRAVLDELSPDLVLVHGDTTSCMASSLAAFYAGIPVGHVEAGLRSGAIAAPFPEEFNRRATALTATYHFAPTPGARANLLAEGCDAGAILVTGNTVVDAVRTMTARLEGDRAFRAAVEASLDASLRFRWREERFVLITCHRRETFLSGLDGALEAFAQLAERYPETHFVYPVHPNPQVDGPARLRLAGIANLHLVEPLDYPAFLHVLRSAFAILTDSGGLQEEAAALSKPALVMRQLTERPEAVEAGGALLVGTQREGIVAGATRLLSDPELHAAMASVRNPFGDGRAAERIAKFLAGRADF